MKTTGLESGTLYPILARLHERGLLSAQWHPADEEGRPPRHAYRLTRACTAYAAEYATAKKRAGGQRQGMRPA